MKKPYVVYDLIPAYQNFPGQSYPTDSAAAAYFKKYLITPHQDVFNAVASRWLEGTNLTDFWEAIRGKEVEFHKVDSAFTGMFEKSWIRFKAAVPDLKNTASIYLLPAPRWAVGGSVRLLSSKDAVIFGAEEIASVIGSQQSFDVLVQHELTHLYHMQVNPEMRKMIAEVYMPPYSQGHAKLYQVLWLEGLAVYQSKKLNPLATDQEILLSSSVAREVGQLWPSIGIELGRVLESSRQDDINRFLFDSDQSGQIPRRAGYYIGMLIAKELSMHHSFASLCRMNDLELKKQIEETLKRLEGLPLNTLKENSDFGHSK